MWKWSPRVHDLVSGLSEQQFVFDTNKWPITELCDILPKVLLGRFLFKWSIDIEAKLCYGSSVYSDGIQFYVT